MDYEYTVRPLNFTIASIKMIPSSSLLTFLLIITLTVPTDAARNQEGQLFAIVHNYS